MNRLINNWLLALVFLSIQTQEIISWQQWDYTSFTTDDWKDTWGSADGPGGRRGHSIVLWDETKIIMFGGRDNEVHKPDVPKTYDLIDDDGILKFDTYDEKPVRSGYDPFACKPEMECVTLENTESGNNQTCSYSWDHVLTNNMTSAQREAKEEQCGFTTTGVYYNDVWVYDLACTRFGDLPCVDDGWKVLHPGARFGGCNNQDGSSLCDTPFARWGHGAIMSDDNTMLVYGGYSQECEDYCDDIWTFNLQSLQWLKIDADSISTPGRRWKFSMVRVSDDGFMKEQGDPIEIALLFGGHRLWHGFPPENSEDNWWQSTDTYELGGYLNDVWILKKALNKTQNDQYVWTWSKLKARQTCLPSPGLTWRDRNDILCETYWPKERSGHAAVYDKERNGVWIHGGFTSHYPYPASSSTGSADGVKEKRKKGFIPFASHSYYLSDLWFYNITSGYWKEMKQRKYLDLLVTALLIKLPYMNTPYIVMLKKTVFDTIGNVNHPSKRQDHLVILSGNILIVHGGYAENHFFNDTWYYYIDENRWLQKNNYVHMFFPEDCTDDMLTIQNEANCVELGFPPPLRRSEQSTFTLNYQDILPYEQQPGYTPDSNEPLYFGIVYNAVDFVASLKKKYLEGEVYDDDGNRIWIKSDVPDGTPIAPNAATGPRQYAQLKQIRYNESFTVKVWEWCNSVEGEPTRGKLLDGSFGRSNDSIRLPQLRRQSPGWDGCRELRWKYPPSRMDHKGLFVERYSMIFCYGGLSYKNVDLVSGAHPNTPSIDETHETIVKKDLWIYGVNICPGNCSNHGTCADGFCHCFPGYYGLDCSNITCPGSVCYYDVDNTQHCTHCCYDGYKHSDEDLNYVSDARKVPCQRKGDLSSGIFTGASNGICDGFGTCQCAPPFLGDDCSIRDCQHDCSFNGYCSIEFPNARCICNSGYFGDYCQYIACPNDCTFPNGVCDHSTGKCSCGAIYSPYNQSQVWSFWQGDDCSYLTPWCGSYRMQYSSIFFCVAVVTFVVNVLFFH